MNTSHTEMPKVNVHDLPNNSCYFHDPDDVASEADTYALATFGGSYFPLYYVIPQDACGRPLDMADTLEVLLLTHEGTLGKIEEEDLEEGSGYFAHGHHYDIEEVHIKEIPREDWEFI